MYILYDYFNESYVSLKSICMSVLNIVILLQIL